MLSNSGDPMRINALAPGQVIADNTAACLRRGGSSLEPSHGTGLPNSIASRRTNATASRRSSRNTPQGSSSAIAEIAPSPPALIRDRPDRAQSQRGRGDTEMSTNPAPTAMSHVQDGTAVLQTHNFALRIRATTWPPKTPRENQGAFDPTTHPVHVQAAPPRSRSPPGGATSHVANQPPRGVHPPRGSAATGPFSEGGTGTGFRGSFRYAWSPVAPGACAE